MTRYRYTIARYVPNVVRDEAVNVGILLQGLEGSPFVFKFMPRTAAVHKLDPRADDSLVRRFERQLKMASNRDAPLGTFGRPTDEGFFESLRADFNGNLQLTAPRGLVADHPREALNKLYQEYVAAPGAAPRPISYQALAPSRVRARLWGAFEKRELVRPDRFSELFNVRGVHSDWVFDLGSANGKIELINSIALNSEASETNLGRALVFKGMVEEVRQGQKNAVEATAVIESGEAPAPGFAEAYDLLRDADAYLVSVGQVEEYAAQIAVRFA